MLMHLNRHPGLRPSLVIALLLASLAWLPAVSAPPTGKPISLEQIGAERKAAETDPGLDETQKSKAQELYDQAAKWLQQAQATKTRLAQLEALVQKAPQRIEAISTGKAQSAGELPDLDKIVASGSLERIELVLSEEQLALQQARETHREQADELGRLLVGTKGMSQEIASRTEALEQIDADLQLPAADEPPNLTQARTTLLKARRMQRQAELDLLKLRLGSHDLLTNLAQAERDFAASEVTARQERLDRLARAAQALRETRAREARQEAEALETSTETLPRPLRVIAQENAGYRLELEQLVSRERTVAGDLQKARTGLDGMKADFERTRQRVDVVGTTEAIGKMLRRRLEELPSPQSYRRTSAKRAEEIGRASDRQIEIDELLRERADIRAVVAGALESLPEAQREAAAPEAEKLARTRRDALNELQKVYSRYIGQITALDLAERQSVEVAGAYVDFIGDQLIWIPGPGLAELVDPRGFGKALVWLLDPGHWAALGQDVWNLVSHRPLPPVLLLGLFLLLLRWRKREMTRLGEISRETRKIRTDAFSLTLRALFATLVIIATWPLLLIGSGWLLERLPTAAPFTLAVGSGLIKAGLILLSGRFLIRLCLPDGLGDRHLRWPQAVREALVHELRWVLPIAVPLGFIVATCASAETAQSLERAAFIGLMAVTTAFIFHLLRGQGKLMACLRNGNGGNPLVQLHFLWFPVLTVLPVLFAAASAWGYHYTALHLDRHAELTFWFFIGLFLLKELLLRSLFIAERRLRYEDALRRREELRAQRAENEEGKGKEEETPLVSLDIPEVNFDELNEQNKRLISTGFLFAAVAGIWGIWSELLPALGFFNTTELPLHASRIVDGIAREVPVTLGDLTVGLILVVITVLAAKNIPGVLEIALLQRLPLDSGARYAITSLTQYTIAGIGVFIAFSTLGLQWSSIQWLLAALSVGLGFGLQEIVANFISGIILLFERPIRVGDVVTLDSTTGVVSRIRIRATTITNWDKQELLIPNKEFITGRVINWTLTDKMNRVVVTVGVAYGSDVQRAMALMLEAATENENVLEDPKPITSFEAFGDNALTLLLRAYLGSMDNRLATITALHQAINDKLNAAGISIAFPQRDMHLDTLRPLDIRLHRGPRGGNGASEQA